MTLVVEPGPAAQLGPVDVTGTERMDPDFVRWMTGIKPGEPYDPDTLGARARAAAAARRLLQRRRSSEDEAVGADGLLPITFNLSERKRR